MDNGDSEPKPYDAIERLCRFVDVHYSIYDLNGSVNRVLDKLKKQRKYDTERAAKTAQ